MYACNFINPLNTRLLCYCFGSETRLFYDVIVIPCNQTRRSPGLVSERTPYKRVKFEMRFHFTNMLFFLPRPIFKKKYQIMFVYNYNNCELIYVYVSFISYKSFEFSHCHYNCHFDHIGYRCTVRQYRFHHDQSPWCSLCYQ